MNSLKIQQGLNVEVVSASIIKKLYEAALSVPEPLEGELDAAYMSGNLQVDRTYRALVSYLTTRFPDLHINVTNSYYIPFEDSNVQSVLMANNISSDGIGITEADASTANLGAMFKNNTNITSFDEFGYFTKANTNPPNGLFIGCSNLSSIDLSNVTTLSSEEFSRTALTDVVLPENVTTIPSYCFSLASSLASVTAPGVLVISQRAFDLCSGLTSFSDFSNVTTIGENAFVNAPLTGVFNAPNLTTLGNYAFKGHKFEGIECIGTLSSIPQNGFENELVYNTLLYIYLPYECTQLGSSAFARAQALTTVKQYDKTISDYQEGETKTFLPNLGKITVFGNACFRECKALTLTSDDITNATEIGNNAFHAVKVTGNVSLPHLTSLGVEAFKDCTTLTSIDLTGSSISELPKGVFSQCSSLSKISIPTSVTTLDEYWCDEIANVLTLEGFDNCVNHSLYNWQLYNKTILNPIKTSFVSDSAIMYLLSNDTNIKYNLLYNPLQTSTPIGRCVYSHEHYTYFTGRPGGGPSRVNIGLLYFRDISSFGALTFYKCNIDNLVINNATPPTLNYSTEASWRYYNTQVWDNNIFPTGNSDQNDNVVIGTLWVPDSAVATYQADPLYSHLNIKGINTKTNGTDYDLPRYATYAAWKVAEEAAVAQGGHAVTGIIEEYM